MNEHVVVVDEHDAEISIAEKMEAHQKGLLHRAFSVVVSNSKGELLLQKRAVGKYHSGGLWSNTCCGHPRPGETTEAAARRRLMEEMGCEAELKKTFSFIYKMRLGDLWEHELDHVFVGQFEGAPSVNADEVAEWKWIGRTELEQDIEENPDSYTYWFKEIVARLNKDVLKGVH